MIACSVLIKTSGVHSRHWEEAFLVLTSGITMKRFRAMLKC